MTELSFSPFEFLIVDAEQLINFGIPHDISMELVPCVARGTWENGKPRTLHLINIRGTEVFNASVVFTEKGAFSRMVLQRSK